MKTDLVKIALNSGCAYLPPGDNKESLYIFSLKELSAFAQGILNDYFKDNDDLTTAYMVGFSDGQKKESENAG